MTPDLLARLNRLHANFRCWRTAESYTDNPVPGLPPIMVPGHRTTCQIYDRTTGTPYITVSVEHPDEPGAIAAALAAAEDAPKPLTPAQLAHQEIASLKAENAALKGETAASEPAPTPKQGVRRKAVNTNAENI